jgi:hypothetical protein
VRHQHEVGEASIFMMVMGSQVENMEKSIERRKESCVLSIGAWCVCAKFWNCVAQDLWCEEDIYAWSLHI